MMTSRPLSGLVWTFTPRTRKTSGGPSSELYLGTPDTLSASKLRLLSTLPTTVELPELLLSLKDGQWLKLIVSNVSGSDYILELRLGSTGAWNAPSQPPKPSRTSSASDRPYFDRPDQCFGEALAWIPQSTVALNTYLGAFQLEDRIPEVQLLLQVHDSLVFQLPKSSTHSSAAIRAALTVVTPYDDPLRIPWSLKASDLSWGECKPVSEE